ncbi:class D sortase [Rossellomorea sp. BNER]|uniref:class D sortase n=1 Tax=Rossellomorea sp. BNER TaxID=2962031 RepID=UPI003AF240BE|nr:class D sortase [Rossellomorea sp. BNER]
MKKAVVICLAILFLVAGGSMIFTNGLILFKGNTNANTVKPVSAEKVISEEVNETEDTPLYSHKPKMGEEIGMLTIPKLEQSLAIYHGVNEDELEKGVGHYQGSVLPGENDNSVLSGHRDTVFRQLGEVKIGDELVVTTDAGEFTYKVQKIRIVAPDDRTIVVPKPRATLTVSTCYPFRFIGPAPERYVLISTLVDSKIYSK